MFIGTSVGMVSATIRPPASAARGEAASWCPIASAERASTVRTFQLSGRWRGDAHGGHEVDLLVAERVEAAVGDVLERGALVGRHLLAEGQHLAAVGVARGDRPAVAVGVGPRLRGREAEASGGQRLGQQRAHGGDLLVGGHLLGAVGAHHLAAHGAVADQEPGVHARGSPRGARGTRRRWTSSTGTPCSRAARGMPSTLAIIRRM